MARNRMCRGIGRVAVILTIFLLLITAFFNYFSYSLARERLHDGYAFVRQQYLESVSFIMEDKINMYASALSARSMVPAGGRIDEKLMAESLEVFIASRGALVDRAMFINREGISEIVVPHSDGMTGLDFSGEGFFRETKESKSSHIDEFWTEDGLKVMIVVPYIPKDGNGEFQGVIAAALDAQLLFDIFLGYVNSGKTSDYIAVINEEGMVLFHPDSSFVGRNINENVDKGRYPELSGLLNNSASGGKGYGTYTFHSHKKEPYTNTTSMAKIMVYEPFVVDDLHWSIHYVTPLEDLEKNSGFNNLKVLLFFNTFMMVILSIIMLSYILFMCRIVLKD